MATYICPKCGMSVNMTCATCGKELVHGTITTDTGVSVAVSKCPDGHGKIKPPQCCGEDMTRSIRPAGLGARSSAPGPHGFHPAGGHR